MDCTENSNRTAIRILSSNVSGLTVAAGSNLLTPPMELDMIPFGNSQWVPMPRQATIAAPKELHFAQYNREARRWQAITDKAILAALTPVFSAYAAEYAKTNCVYHWSSGDNVFLNDYEINHGQVVRLKVEVL